MHHQRVGQVLTERMHQWAEEQGVKEIEFDV
jgi:hypothetical protein